MLFRIAETIPAERELNSLRRNISAMASPTPHEVTARSKRDLTAACIAAAFVALVLIVDYSRWPYSYYEAFRWIICLATVYTAYLVRSHAMSLAACVAVAVIFNPLAPFRMRYYDWQRVDILGAIAMAGVAIYAWKIRAR
jgi:hypothetical protein